MDTKQIINPDKESSKQVGNGGLEEKSIPSSKLNSLVGLVDLPKDFNEEIELRNYFENKHL